MSNDCSVRLVTHKDLPMILDWRNQPSIRQYMLTQHEISLVEHQNWFAKSSLDTTRCMVIIEELDRPIGFVQFSNISDGRIANWGFYARPDAPKGNGKKLGIAALSYGFSELSLHKVCGQAIEKNTISIAFHKALGFTQEGVLREQQLIGSTYHSLVCFGLLNHEWQTLRSREKHANA